MDFIYLFRVLLKRKWLILIAGLIAGVLAYFLTQNQPKYFKSRAQISTGFTISDDIKVNDANFSFFEADTKFSNAIITSTSPTVLSLLSYRLIIHDLKSEKPFRELSEDQKKSPLVQSIKKDSALLIYEKKLENTSMLNSYNEEEKDLLAFLKLYQYDNQSIGKYLSVYRLDRTDYIQIDFVSNNPELSAFVVNTLFQEFIRYYRNVRSNKSEESTDTLKSLMDKKRIELEAKNAVLRGEGIINQELQSGSSLELISSLEQALSEEKNTRITLISSLRKVNQKLAGSSIPTNSKSVSENNELLLLRNAMNEAYKEYISSGSTDADLLNKYNRLKTQYQNKYATANLPDNENKENIKVNKVLNDEKNGLEIDIQASNLKIGSIQGKINNLKGNLVYDANKGATIETLLKEADLANKEYLDAKQRYNDAIDKSSSVINNFRQILVGQPAIDPEPSKRKLLIGMAVISAVFLTTFIIVLLTFLDSSLRTPVIFSKSVKLKLISMINFMNLKKENLMSLVTNTANAELGELKRLNIFRESIRKLRYEIENSGKKIFLFTSSEKGEGKTTLIQALSYSLSLSKKKILIIDTNFCNNDLTVQMNAKPVLEKIGAEGIDNVSIVDLIQNISTCVIEDSIYIIGSEGGDYTPSEILPKENLLQFLKPLSQHFDYIFLEGPPLNDYSDSKELANYVEGVIAIFSATHVVKQIDKASFDFLRNLGDKFTGAILNKVDMENVQAA